MPLIPNPNVPGYPGVPSIPRTAPGVPAISINLADASQSLAVAEAFAAQWGIYDTSGDQLYTPSTGTLSTFSISYQRSMQISDFPIEANATGQGAAFASFNKVFVPANPIVTMALSGSDAELSAFLSAVDAACISTALYDVYTPDATYEDYSIESYSYQRTARQGATMLLVEISLKQILQVSASYSNPLTPDFIKLPQSPSASQQVNDGLLQLSTPNAATLSRLYNFPPLNVGP